MIKKYKPCINVELFVNHKLNELNKLGGATKQLSKKRINQKLIKRCHIAMSYIVVEVWPIRDRVFNKRPELKNFFKAMLLLYQDCINGHMQEYIDGNEFK